MLALKDPAATVAVPVGGERHLRVSRSVKDDHGEFNPSPTTVTECHSPRIFSDFTPAVVRRPFVRRVEGWDGFVDVESFSDSESDGSSSESDSDEGGDEKMAESQVVDAPRVMDDEDDSQIKELMEIMNQGMDATHNRNRPRPEMINGRAVIDLMATMSRH
eukprot:gene10884-13820_t